MKILIVDDSRSSRLMVKSCLKDLHCEIEEADGGEVAIEKFKTGAFDLVIMDIHMPKVDGYETTRKIRAFEAVSKSVPKPILMLTAMDPAQATPKALAFGATACLSKPVKQAVLLEAVRMHAAPGTVVPAPAPVPEEPKEASGRFKKLFGMSKKAESDGIEQAELSDERPAFVAEKLHDIKVAMVALDAGDLETVRLMAHRLKGEGANFGFKEVSEFGAALAAACERMDMKTARGTVQKLQAFLTSN